MNNNEKNMELKDRLNLLLLKIDCSRRKGQPLEKYSLVKSYFLELSPLMGGEEREAIQKSLDKVSERPQDSKKENTENPFGFMADLDSESSEILEEVELKLRRVQHENKLYL